MWIAEIVVAVCVAAWALFALWVEKGKTNEATSDSSDDASG